MKTLKPSLHLTPNYAWKEVHCSIKKEEGILIN